MQWHNHIGLYLAQKPYINPSPPLPCHKPLKFHHRKRRKKKTLSLQNLQNLHGRCWCDED